MVPRGRRYVSLITCMGRIRCSWEKESIVVAGYDCLKPFELLLIENNKTATLSPPKGQTELLFSPLMFMPF